MTGEKCRGSFGKPTLDDLISLARAAQLSGLSTSDRRLLVSRGDIWGVKLGRNSVITSKAVQEYVARDRRPGPAAQPAGSRSEVIVHGLLHPKYPNYSKAFRTLVQAYLAALVL